MKIKSAILLGACLGSLPAVDSFAHGALPFTILSRSVDAPARRRALTDFSLVERSGKKITLADLRGKISIVDFIYTSCSDTCPLQTADMAKLQEQWIKEREVELISVSVDPEHDTPRVLTKYAGRFRADPERWLFLTGPKKQIDRLIEDGFRLPIAQAFHGDHGSVVHSSRFVLVNQQAQVCGYYDNRDPQAMERLKADVTGLLQHLSASQGIPGGSF
jgi:cytochrome oxidase Cu insertion factor (SCO1/SenC/PrrC family)